MTIRSHEDLDAWQEAMKLAEAAYAASSAFPGEEKYALTQQVRRAAISIPSNIAEGHARFSTREFLRFLSITMGSLAELRTQCQLATRLGFAQPEAMEPVILQADKVGRLVRGLAKSLQSRLGS